MIILSLHLFEEDCFVKYPFRIVLLIVQFRGHQIDVDLINKCFLVTVTEKKYLGRIDEK